MVENALLTFFTSMLACNKNNFITTQLFLNNWNVSATLCFINCESENETFKFYIKHLFDLF
jgi:hypothetical protein